MRLLFFFFQRLFFWFCDFVWPKELPPPPPEPEVILSLPPLAQPKAQPTQLFIRMGVNEFFHKKPRTEGNHGIKT